MEGPYGYGHGVPYDGAYVNMAPPYYPPRGHHGATPVQQQQHQPVNGCRTCGAVNLASFKFCNMVRCDALVWVVFLRTLLGSSFFTSRL